MLHNSINAGPMSPEALPSDPPGADQRLAHLREQERMWFSWVTVLHERLGKPDVHKGLDVLEIAKKRWLDAKQALHLYQAGD